MKTLYKDKLLNLAATMAQSLGFNNAKKGKLQSTNVQDAIDELTTSKQDELTAGNNVSISSDNVISATDTTYTSKSASANSTEVSLCTRGEKALWNSKTANTGTVTSVAVKINGSTKGTITTSGTIDLGSYHPASTKLTVSKTTYDDGTLKYTNGNYSVCSNATQSRNAANSAWTPMYASAFTAQSSNRVKKNVEDLTETEAKKLLDLRPVTFDYINELDGINCKGLIAEEVYEVIPSAVIGDIHCADGDIEALMCVGIDYSKFAPYLIKMIQMQQKEINGLKTRLDKLESKGE